LSIVFDVEKFHPCGIFKPFILSDPLLVLPGMHEYLSTRLIGRIRHSELRLWHVTIGEELQRLRGHEYPVRTVAASPDGTFIASAGEEAIGHRCRDSQQSHDEQHP